MASEDEHDGGSSHGDFEEDSMVLKILIAATAAGSIIGKGGSTINEFQVASGARIQLSRNGETFPGTTDRVISLGGGVADIVGAVHLMIQKLTQDGAELVEGEPRVRVVVPNASCGAVIGKGGATIRRFQEDSGANIKLSSQDRMLPGVTDRVLTVTGDAANVLRAIANVAAALSEDEGYLPHAKRPSAFLASSPGPAPRGPARGGGPKPGEVSVTVAVPDEHIGAVLGKGGRTISEIQVASGVRIKVSDRGDFIPGTRNRSVTLFGTEEGTRAAQALLAQKLSSPGPL